MLLVGLDPPWPLKILELPSQQELPPGPAGETKASVGTRALMGNVSKYRDRDRLGEGLLENRHT